jgi:type IV pilus assembly protein PilW
MNAPIKQTGATLIELLISIVIGLIITASLLGMYLTSTTNSGQILKTSKLNQELTTLMTVMVNDIRRAGYWLSDDIQQSSNNPFNQEDTKLTVTNSCITYAYNANANNTLDATDLFGFRLNEEDDVVQMRQIGSTAAVNDCTDTDSTWIPLTDKNYIRVTELSFGLTPSDTILGSVTLETNMVSIRLTGSLVSDPSTLMTLEQNVRVRNDRVKI